MDPRILSNLGLPPNNYSGQSTSGMLMDLCEQLAGGHRSQLMIDDTDGRGWEVRGWVANG